MKTLKNLKKIYVIVLALAVIYSCSDDDSSESKKTIYERISENPDLTTFTAALDKLPTLKDILNDDTELVISVNTFTVFAPTNNSFDTFLLANGYDGIEAVDVENPTDAEFLSNYMYNLIVEEKTSSNVMREESTGYLRTFTSESTSMLFNIPEEGEPKEGDIVLNGAATVLTSDINARNGVVHIVDGVIPIPTLTTFVEASPDFDTLRQALEIITNEEGSTISDDLTNAVQYTVFVPTDAAFESLYEEETLNGLDDLDSAVIEDIVEVHVIQNNNFDSSDIEDAVGGTINTLTDVLEVAVDGNENYTLTDPQARTAVIIKTDVRASNGIIHIIDKVLLGN